MSKFSMDELVVTSAFRDWVTSSNLGQFSFKPVVKDHIVEMNWNLWDESSDTDVEIPRDVDNVEEYLSTLPHSEEASQALGELWEWIIPVGAIMDLDVPSPHYS